MPKGDLVLAKVAEAEEKTTGGILLPGSAQTRPTSGEVVALGDGQVGTKQHAFTLKGGETVLYSRFGIGATELEVQGEQHLLIREDDLIGIMPRPNATAEGAPAPRWAARWAVRCGAVCCAVLGRLALLGWAAGAAAGGSRRRRHLVGGERPLAGRQAAVHGGGGPPHSLPRQPGDSLAGISTSPCQWPPHGDIPPSLPPPSCLPFSLPPCLPSSPLLQTSPSCSRWATAS